MINRAEERDNARDAWKAYARAHNLRRGHKGITLSGAVRMLRKKKAA